MMFPHTWSSGMNIMDMLGVYVHFILTLVHPFMWESMDSNVGRPPVVKKDLLSIFIVMCLVKLLQKK